MFRELCAEMEKLVEEARANGTIAPAARERHGKPVKRHTPQLPHKYTGNYVGTRSLNASLRAVRLGFKSTF